MTLDEVMEDTNLRRRLVGNRVSYDFSSHTGSRSISFLPSLCYYYLLFLTFRLSYYFVVVTNRMFSHIFYSILLWLLHLALFFSPNCFKLCSLSQGYIENNLSTSKARVLRSAYTLPSSTHWVCHCFTLTM